MRALTWQGKRSVSVETVPDPIIEQPTDAVIGVTSTAICGSDLHLYEVLGPFLNPGDGHGHETMGMVSLATHRPPLDDATAAYEMFQKKQNGCVKVVLKP